MQRQTRRDLRATLLAAGIFILAVVIAIPAFSQTNEVGRADTLATQSVVRDQLDAFRSRDHNRAYSHAAPNIKGYFDNVDKFISMVSRGYGAIYNSEAYLFGRNMMLNSEVYQEVIITDESGRQWQAVYTLKQQDDGSWKITGVKMNPYNGAAT